MKAIASCAENARRISEMQDSSLPLAPRLSLWIHLAGCRLCRRYLRQVRFLHKLLPEFRERLGLTASETLPAESRANIKRLLRDLREEEAGGESQH